MFIQIVTTCMLALFGKYEKYEAGTQLEVPRYDGRMLIEAGQAELVSDDEFESTDEKDADEQNESDESDDQENESDNSDDEAEEKGPLMFKPLPYIGEGTSRYLFLDLGIESYVDLANACSNDRQTLIDIRGLNESRIVDIEKALLAAL